MRAALRRELAGKGINIMLVQCLGSCRRPCAVAFDAPDKARIRFSDIVVQDANLLVEAAYRYVQFGVGPTDRTAFPMALQSKISAIAPKRTVAGI